MFGTLIPLFDSQTQVKAYSIFAQKYNSYTNPSILGTGWLDGAGSVLGIDIVESMGIETLTDDKTVFVEVNSVSIFSDIDSQFTDAHDKLVLLFDHSVTPTEMYVERLKALKASGYKLAIRKLSVKQFEEYKSILSLVDYVLLDHKKIDISKAKIYFQKIYPNVSLVAVNVNTQEDYDTLTADGGYDLYEGKFFRLPIVNSSKDVSPMKATYVELLNIVNDPDFDLDKAAGVIEHDTALVISLLAMVNRMTVNSGISTVGHAAAMLGQKELKRWINTAVTKELCSDKPGEITRVSLIRARFAELLAPVFGLAGNSSELFLMGLFSVIDAMLDKPMKEALEMVRVSKDISGALIDGTGKYAPVLEFLTAYESADWSEVSRQLILINAEDSVVYDSYTSSLSWFRDLFYGNGTAEK
ncbi:MAG: HDOD domain-containing protein [Lachnospiraceae bacterium]|nr:HDOD domain-containing protein [Lachnospiraceae bacterium]